MWEISARGTKFLYAMKLTPPTDLDNVIVHHGIMN